ncbi:MAG: MBL fold metallo-hydrolase [Hyphomicrobiales bacterium]|nr:MBL fold metallo-hydrolase [Hyphomicrobiales bacterium]
MTHERPRTESLLLSYPLATPPEPGTMIEVADGVFWIRMPMPLALDHINLWLLADGDDWTLVDTGLGVESTCELWRRIFDGPAANRTPRRLLCTHYHPDHFGLSGWLARTYSLAVFMTEMEWTTGNLLQRLDNSAYATGQDAFFAANGLAADARTWCKDRGNTYRKRVLPAPDTFSRIRDGETLVIGGRTWRVMTAEGHAPEHACLYCAELGVLIAGDQILPKISPNISVQWYKGGSRPLADYLASLNRFYTLPSSTLVLPSHKLPFYGLHARLDELHAHHDERLVTLTRVFSDCQARTAAECLPHLFHESLLETGDGRDLYHIMFAIGESVAHLTHLVDTGVLREVKSSDDLITYQQQQNGRTAIASNT